MMSNFVRTFGALLCVAGFTLVTTSGAQALKLIRGQHTEFMWQGLANIGVTVTNDAGGVVMKAQTDANGEIRTSSLPPGEYQVEVDGPSVIAAIHKVAPPAKKSSGPSVSIGGFFGGGSSRSSPGHEGNGHQQSNSHSSGSMGVGMAVPIGRNDSNTDGGRAQMLSISLTRDGPHGRDSSRSGGVGDHGQPSAYWVASNALDDYSMEVPYCRDTASQGMRIGFTIPNGKGPAGMPEEPRVIGISLGASW